MPDLAWWSFYQSPQAAPLPRPAGDGRPQQVDIDVGARVRRRREQLGLSLSATAQSCAISPAQLGLHENGEVWISAARLLALAVVLKVEISYFFADRQAL